MILNKKQKLILIGAATIISAVVFMITFVTALLAPLTASEIFTYSEALKIPSDRIIPVTSEEEIESGTVRLPVRLMVPQLSIDAKIQYVGTTTTGAMGIPSNFSDVAWYKFGTMPGEKGSAVIDGHLDNGLGLPAVFNKLEELKRGDSLYVVTEGEQQIEFIVERLENYEYTQLPLQEIFHRNDDVWLNLITCSGSWIKDKKTYNQRLVVYTRRIK
jgi:LPXTG-site transpeptidase (sortase) family protein